jgi:hypothetical protein
MKDDTPAIVMTHGPKPSFPSRIHQDAYFGMVRAGFRVHIVSAMRENRRTARPHA